MMASDTNETIADIVAEIRAYGAQPPPRLMWLEIADRLEAAWKREREPKPLTIPEWIDNEESIADIAAVLRRYVLPSLAERLEAAWKRERAKIEADALAVGGIVESARQKPVGNAAAMREAFKKIDDEMSFCDRNVEFGIGFALEGLREHCRIVREILKSALAEPPRNCDVGTAGEQEDRFTKVCTANSKDGVRGLCSETCPFSRDYQSGCALAWAQMPYEEGGAK